MRADRLLSILMLLQNERQLTTRQLADRLEVSERTVHRDMEALGAAGVPVYSVLGSQGGWRLSEGYRTGLTGLHAPELIALLATGSEQLLRDLGKQQLFDQAYRKVVAAAPASVRRDAEFARERIHIDGAGWHDEPIDRSVCLPTIQEAIWSERKLAIAYERGEELVQRLTHPLGLVAKRSTWYMVAETDGDIRTYRVSRIRSAVIGTDSFQRPEAFRLAAYWQQSTEQFTADLPKYAATIGIKRQQLKRLRQERYVKVVAVLSESTAESPDWLELDVQFNTLESACSICLSYGAELVVRQPEELRDRVNKQAVEITRLYL
ncbi:MAG: transcriptional regulator [Paenibacillus sp.]|nr:transcriptional regulator [Paenibacillus sp.]